MSRAAAVARESARLEREIPGIVIVECLGGWRDEWAEILGDLAALWTGATSTPAGELHPVLVASLIDRRSN